MLRLLEIALFLAPFAGYALWLRLGRRRSRELLWGTLGLMLGLLVAAAWLELSGAVPPDMTYVPPHMENGHIIPGHAVRGPRP